MYSNITYNGQSVQHALTAICAVMCVQQAIFAPASGFSLPVFLRSVIIPHISEKETCRQN